MGGTGDRGHQGLMNAINRDGRLWHQHARDRHLAVRQVPAAFGVDSKCAHRQIRNTAGRAYRSRNQACTPGCSPGPPLCPQCGNWRGHQACLKPSVVATKAGADQGESSRAAATTRSARTRRPTPTSSLVSERCRVRVDTCCMYVWVCDCSEGTEPPHRRWRGGLAS